ncbi:unnamed protein product, partial [Amoebophrya sp. A25]
DPDTYVGLADLDESASRECMFRINVSSDAELERMKTCTPGQVADMYATTLVECASKVDPPVTNPVPSAAAAEEEAKPIELLWLNLGILAQNLVNALKTMKEANA